MSPSALERVGKGCPEKDPHDRMQTAHDVRRQLKWIPEGGSQVTSLPTAAVKGIRAFGRQGLLLRLGTLL